MAGGGGDYFKYSVKGGRLFEERLLFEEIRYTDLGEFFDPSLQT